MTDVCLVSMPFARIESPSLALGLLKSSLKSSHINSRALYPNLWLAEELGIYKYKVFSELYAEFFVGEWLFSSSAFPDFEPDDSKYFQSLKNCNKEFIDLLYETRERAKKFVDRVAQDILDIQPLIVSCSSTFHQNCASLALLRRLRELKPSLITIMGGANCEGIMGLTLHQEFPWVDFVCSGEGEEIFPKLCSLLIEKGKNINTHDLPYGVFGPKSGENLQNNEPKPRAVVTNFDQTPIPDFDDYFETLKSCNNISPYISPGLFIETTRGCWWGQKQHCTFCGLNGQGMSYRSKSSPRVVEEFAYLSKKYNVRKFFVVDNILNLEFINTVLPKFTDLPDPYIIFFETKANLKYEQVKQLAEAGVHWLQPGLESMNDEALVLMKKGTTALINIQLLKWGKELGIQMIWNYLVGLPKEELNWYEEVLDWLPIISHLQPPTEVRKVGFHRFSPYHNLAKEYGLQLKPLSHYSNIYPLNLETLNNFAYHFELIKASSSSSNIPNDNLDNSEINYHNLEQYIKEWQNNYYSNNSPVLNIIEDDGKHMKILDTRNCTRQKEILLEGLTYQVYKYCQNTISMNKLKYIMAHNCNSNCEWEKVQEIVFDLQTKKILLLLNNQLLGLATQKLSSRILDARDQPGGYIDIKKYIKEAQNRFWETTPSS